MTQEEQEEVKLLKELIADKSISADEREIYEDALNELMKSEKPKAMTSPSKPTTTQRKTRTAPTKKVAPAKTKKTATDVEKAKAEIKAKTGKTEAECESIIEQYRSLRTKAQEGKRKAEQASADNKERVNKLGRKGDIIAGTNEKTADAVIESSAKDVAQKIEKEVGAVEAKAEKEAKAEVAKDKSITTAKDKKEAVEAIVDEQVKAKTKTIVKRVVIDTSALLTSIATSLGKFDKDSQKEFLIKLRSDIDKLLSKYAFGGMTDGATQVMNVQQSNMSSSSVNPSQFAHGGGVESEYIVKMQNEDSGDIQTINVLAKTEDEAIENALNESGLSSDYILFSVNKKYAKGGGVRIGSDGREYPYGSAWKLEHNKNNKNEDYEVATGSRKNKYSVGGTLLSGMVGAYVGYQYAKKGKKAFKFEDGGVVGQEIVIDYQGDEYNGVIKDITNAGDYIVLTDNGRSVLAQRDMDVISLGGMAKAPMMEEKKKRFGLFGEGGGVDMNDSKELENFIVNYNRNARKSGMNGFSKGDLMKMAYGDNYTNVDSALPMGLLEEMGIDKQDYYFYVMDYNNNSFGKLTNLMDKIAQKNPMIEVYDEMYEITDTLPIMSAVQKYKNQDVLFEVKKFAEGGGVDSLKKGDIITLIGDEYVFIRYEKDNTQGYEEERIILKKSANGEVNSYPKDMVEAYSKYAKGGMTEHGLRVGDRIEADGKTFGYKDEIQVIDSDKKEHIVNLDKGRRTNVRDEFGV